MSDCDCTQQVADAEHDIRLDVTSREEDIAALEKEKEGLEDEVARLNGLLEEIKALVQNF